MDSGVGIRDYDYIIHEPDGRIIKVKDGVKYMMSREEWVRENPKHMNSGCTDCSFVQDKDTLLIFIVSREMREEVTERPYYIGNFTMPDWTGHCAFYLFKCGNCNAVRVDYPHGYTSGGRIYLRCDLCDEQLVLHPSRDRDIYKRDNINVPVEPSRKERRQMIRLLKSKRKEIESVQDLGVIPLVVPSNVQSKTLSQRLRSFFSMNSKP